LSAHLDGEPVTSIDFNSHAWDELKADVRSRRRALSLQPCGVPATAKTSPLGLHFFAHTPGETPCTAVHPGESREHLAAKAEILKGCLDAGWPAAAEVRAPDGSWIADVLADNGTHKIAFEVQISPQTRLDYERRQAQYAVDGVRCAWYVTHQTSVLTPSTDLPIFLIQFPAEQTRDVRAGASSVNAEITVAFEQEQVPLRHVARMRLRGQITYRSHLTFQRPSTFFVATEPTVCSRCQQPFLLWQVRAEEAASACGIWVSHAQGGLERSDGHALGLPSVLAAVQQVADRRQLAPARYALPADGTGQMRLRCPSCSVPAVGANHAPLLGSAVEGQPEALRVPGHPEPRFHPHWCLTQGDTEHCHDLPEDYPSVRPSARNGSSDREEGDRLVRRPDQVARAAGAWCRRCCAVAGSPHDCVARGAHRPTHGGSEEPGPADGLPPSR